MDAYLSNSQNSANIFDPPPILVAADTDSARARALATAAMSGLRVTGTVAIEDAADRISQQVAASALWIELDGDNGLAIERLLEAVSADVAGGRYDAILSLRSERLDSMAPCAMDPNINVIVDAGESERAAALALAVSGMGRTEWLSDVTADKNAARLRQLSDEMSRIAATLARLSAGPGATSRPLDSEPLGDAPEVSIETVRAVIRARRLRSRYFPEDLFGDPAWDMLLDLLQAEIAKLRVPVSSLCIAAAVPATTALRWLKTMVQEGLFVRRADPHDGRRVFVELAPQTSQALRRYFAEVGRVAVI